MQVSSSNPDTNYNSPPAAIKASAFSVKSKFASQRRTLTIKEKLRLLGQTPSDTKQGQSQVGVTRFSEGSKLNNCDLEKQQPWKIHKMQQQQQQPMHPQLTTSPTIQTKLKHHHQQILPQQAEPVFSEGKVKEEQHSQQVKDDDGDNNVPASLNTTDPNIKPVWTSNLTNELIRKNSKLIPYRDSQINGGRGRKADNPTGRRNYDIDDDEDESEIAEEETQQHNHNNHNNINYQTNRVAVNRDDCAQTIDLFDEQVDWERPSPQQYQQMHPPVLTLSSNVGPSVTPSPPVRKGNTAAVDCCSGSSNGGSPPFLNMFLQKSNSESRWRRHPRGTIRGFNPMQSIIQSPLRTLQRGHTIQMRDSCQARGAAGESEGEVSDIDEQVQILELAIEGKFDNRKSIRKQGGVDFSSQDDNESTNKRSLLPGQNGPILLRVAAGDANQNVARPTIGEKQDQFYASNSEFNGNDEDDEDDEDDEIAQEEIGQNDIRQQDFIPMEQTEGVGCEEIPFSVAGEAGVVANQPLPIQRMNISASNNYSNFLFGHDGDDSSDIGQEETYSKPQHNKRAGDFNRILMLSSDSSPFKNNNNNNELKQTRSRLVAEESLPYLPEASLTGLNIHNVTPIREHKQETLDITNMDYLQDMGHQMDHSNGIEQQHIISVDQIEKQQSSSTRPHNQQNKLHEQFPVVNADIVGNCDKLVFQDQQQQSEQTSSKNNTVHNHRYQNENAVQCETQANVNLQQTALMSPYRALIKETMTSPRRMIPASPSGKDQTDALLFLPQFGRDSQQQQLTAGDMLETRPTEGLMTELTPKAGPKLVDISEIDIDGPREPQIHISLNNSASESQRSQSGKDTQNEDELIQNKNRSETSRDSFRHWNLFNAEQQTLDKKKRRNSCTGFQRGLTQMLIESDIKNQYYRRKDFDQQSAAASRQGVRAGDAALLQCEKEKLRKRRKMSEEGKEFAQQNLHQVGKDTNLLNFMIKNSAHGSSHRGSAHLQPDKRIIRPLNCCISSMKSDDVSEQINSTIQDSQLSETSTDRDVSMILNHSVLSEDDFFTHQKRRKPQPEEIFLSHTNLMFSSNQSVPVYDTYETAVEYLQSGFIARKYNYSNDDIYDVRIKLSSDAKYLEYDKVVKGFKDYFKPLRRLEIKSIYDFLYGGCTDTFKKHQSDNLTQLEKRSEKKLTVSERPLQSRSCSLRLKDKQNQVPVDESKKLNDDSDGIAQQDTYFYPWQCISIYRFNTTTLDLLIYDNSALMSLLHVLHKNVYINLLPGAHFMKLYKTLKFRMKLHYEAWSRKISIGTLILYAVLKTLQQKLGDCTRILQAFIKDPRFNDQHRLLSISDDSKSIVRTTPNQKLLRKQIRLMEYNLKTGFLKEFFTEEFCKLKWRTAHFKALYQMQKNEPDAIFSGSQSKDLNFDSMLTYGNVLYDFCSYRLKLKTFFNKRQQLRKIHQFLKLNYEVVRAVQKKQDMDMVIEFYHDFDYQQFQAHLRRKMQDFIKEDLENKAVAGADFNSFLLVQRQDSSSTAYKEAALYLIKQVQLMHRVALMQQKVCYLCMGYMQEKQMRSQYRQRRHLAEKEYDEAFNTVKRYEASIRKMDYDHGLSLDLNKIAHLAQYHEQMLNQLCGTYDLKNKFVMAATQMRKNREDMIVMAVEKTKYRKLRKQEKKHAKLEEKKIKLSAHDKPSNNATAVQHQQWQDDGDGSADGIVGEEQLAADDEVSISSATSNDTVDTQEAKNIRLHRHAVKKLGAYYLKINHKQALARYFMLLPEQQRILFDRATSKNLNLGAYLTNKSRSQKKQQRRLDPTENNNHFTARILR